MFVYKTKNIIYFSKKPWMKKYGKRNEEDFQ